MENEYDGQQRSSNRVMPRRPTKYRITKQPGGVTLIEITGRMAPSDANDELCKRIDSLIDAGDRRFLLDLSGVTYISSTGVGSILQSYHHIERADGHLKILTPSQCVSHIIRISKLDNVFEVFDDEAKAIQSFDAVATEAPSEKKARIRKTKD